MSDGLTDSPSHGASYMNGIVVPHHSDCPQCDFWAAPLTPAVDQVKVAEVKEPLKGILVYVYRDASSRIDATKGGLTSRFTRAVLVGEGVPQCDEADEKCPALVLVKRTLNPISSAGPAYEYLHAEPADLNQQGAFCSFGGNFIHTSDSRFPSKYPIPVHDHH